MFEPTEWETHPTLVNDRQGDNASGDKAPRWQPKQFCTEFTVPDAIFHKTRLIYNLKTTFLLMLLFLITVAFIVT